MQMHTLPTRMWLGQELVNMLVSYASNTMGDAAMSKMVNAEDHRDRTPLHEVRCGARAAIGATSHWLSLQK